MPGNLYQRPGSPFWWARVQVNGVDHRRSLRTDDRAEAKRRLKALLAEADDRRAGIEPPVTHRWQDAVLRYLDMDTKGLRPATVARYKLSLRHLNEHFRGKDVALLVGADFHEFAAWRLAGGVTPATVRRDLTVASRVMRIAKRAGWRTDNPVPDEAGELTEHREPVQPVPLRAIGRLLRVAGDGGMAPLIRFLWRTGCRAEEAAGLEWSQVDLEHGRCLFAHTKTRSPRTIDLTQQTVRELRRQRRVAGVDAVFLSRDDLRYRNISGQFRVLVTRSFRARDCMQGGSVSRGVSFLSPRFRCHDLRHTYAIRWLQKGGDIYRLSRHLGHSSVKTTEIYSAWMRNEDRTLAQKPAQSRSQDHPSP